MHSFTSARLRTSAVGIALLVTASLLSACGSGRVAAGDTTIFTDLKRNPTTTVSDTEVVDSSTPQDSTVIDESVPEDSVTQDTTIDSTDPVVDSSAPAAASGDGPVANADHWHAAYGIYDCDHYAAAIDGTQMDDPDGIHTHDDGLIHIHPFTDAAAGKNAVLARFMKVVGIDLTATSLKVPSLDLAVADGDDCGGKPGKVRVVMFTGADHLTASVVKDPANLRLQQGQVIAFVFAPADTKLTPPPSLETLETPPDVPITFEMTAARKALVGEPPVVTKPVGDPPTKLVITDLEVGTGPAVSSTAKVGVMYTLMAWSTGKQVDSNWTSGEIFGFLMGAGRTIPGFEQGITGMKVGGLRKIVVPPALAYGDQSPTDLIKAGETLVFWVRLMAFEERKATSSGTVPTTAAPTVA